MTAYKTNNLFDRGREQYLTTPCPGEAVQETPTTISEQRIVTLVLI